MTLLKGLGSVSSVEIRGEKSAFLLQPPDRHVATLPIDLSFSSENNQKSAFGLIRGKELPPRLLEQLIEGSVACDKSSDMREFANTMYLIVILRFVFGGLSKTSAVIRSTRFFKGLVSKWSCVRAEFAPVAPHEWMRMDYVLTGVRDGYVYCGRGTFKQANHPLRPVLWFCRRLAGRPEPYLTLAAAVCLVNSRTARR